MNKDWFNNEEEVVIAEYHLFDTKLEIQNSNTAMGYKHILKDKYLVYCVDFMNPVRFWLSFKYQFEAEAWFGNLYLRGSILKDTEYMLQGDNSIEHWTQLIANPVWAGFGGHLYRALYVINIESIEFLPGTLKRFKHLLE